MSPIDMLVFLFLILMTVKVSLMAIDYWKAVEAEEQKYLGRSVRRGPSPAAVHAKRAAVTPVVKKSSRRAA